MVTSPQLRLPLNHNTIYSGGGGWFEDDVCVGEHDGTAGESIKLRGRPGVDGAVVATQGMEMGDSGSP